jgi:hypothetical protein
VNAAGLHDGAAEELGAVSKTAAPSTANAHTANSDNLRSHEPNISTDLPFLASIPA